MFKSYKKLKDFIQKNVTTKYHYKLENIYKNSTGEWKIKFRVNGTSTILTKELGDLVKENDLLYNFSPEDIVKITFDAQEDRKEAKHSIVRREFGEEGASTGLIFFKTKGEKGCKELTIREILESNDIKDNLSKDDLIYLGLIIGKYHETERTKKIKILKDMKKTKEEQ